MPSAAGGPSRVVRQVCKPSRSSILAFAGADSGRHRRQFQDPKYRGHHLQQRRVLVIPVDAVLDRLSSSVVVPPSDILQHFANLLFTKEGADVAFEAGGKTFTAHRCVLAARSTVFKAELFGPMKEGTATSGVIKVDDMEAPVFEAMLKFIYTDSLPPELEEKDGHDRDMAMWQHLLVAADRYDLRRLRLMCEDRLCEYIDLSTATTILMLAEEHHCRGLKEACLQFLECPANLKKVMAIDGLGHLTACCPSVLKDLIAKLVTH